MNLGDAIANEMATEAMRRVRDEIADACARGIAICPNCLRKHYRVGTHRWSITPRCLSCASVLVLP